MVLRQLFLTCLFFISLLSTVVGQNDPQNSLSSFEGRPFALFFFEDTESAIYFDSQTGLIHVSQDEGKTWKQADEIPKEQAVLVIPHPFNNRVAFVLTSGTTHYRTTDRGKSWTSFDLPVTPAFVARPLSFHSDKPDYIIYQGRNCSQSPIGWGNICTDVAYYTKEAFADTPELLLTDIAQCQFAHSSKEWKHDAHTYLIYCVGYDSSTINGMHSPESSRLFSSTDFFKTKKLEDLGIAKSAKGVVAFAVVSKYAVVALRDLSSLKGEMLLYVTIDTQTWARAKFPHASSAQLRENAYTILESTTHSLAVDVVLHDSRGGAIGTLFVSNSNGTYFTQSLADTNRNDYGYVDFERVYGVEGVGLVNIVANAQDVEGRGSSKQLRTRITFNDGRTWSPLEPPSSEGECDKSNEESCSLQLHSVTSPHNYGRVFSSPAPGLLMGVGAVASSLTSYRSSKTFLSTDAGVTWRKIKDTPHKYEFGDSGSIIVIVPDNEEIVDSVEYSLDFGRTWKPYNFGQRLIPKALLTVPDSTSQKFILLGEVAREDRSSSVGEWVTVQLDFARTRQRQCAGAEDATGDFEKWNARPRESECLMGRKQWYTRRKPDATCYVGGKFADPVPHTEQCECTDEDYECDFNYVRSGKECVAMGPEPVPADYCLPNGNGKYLGSSGWRKIPGDECYVPSAEKGKDALVEKDCSNASPAEGQIVHQVFQFPDRVVQHGYFRNSRTILARLADGRLFQSSNEGYSWQEPVPDGRFVAFFHHPHSHDRAYLITQTERFYATTDSGRSWNPFTAPTPPNTFRSQILRFHTDSEKLIWTGNKNCGAGSRDCHAEAHYSRDNGRKWDFIDSYVVNCAWAIDTKLNADPTEIICESYRDKKGHQAFFHQGNNALELVEGKSYYKNKKRLFPRVAGFAKFSEYLVVAELREDQANTLQLEVSLDGVKFAEGQFPPLYDPHTHAYTVLESSTDALFLHMTTSESPYPYWGHLLKSNSNGTYFNVILENVNRNNDGYVDFEKVIGLDGIALVNVISNPQQAMITGVKELQSKITHNDGGSWKYLQPPETDSLGNPYECNGIKCHLNIHGYTERIDPRATYSSPSTIGVLIAVGNVGETLAPYTSSDTFLSRDAGFTWTEVRKDAHLWEFGDSGSLLVLANDEEATDRILYSTDEGLSWHEYQFTSPGEDKVRVWAIVTVYEDDSRKFILFGTAPRSPQASVAIHVDFSALTNKKCVFNVEDPTHDDFEKWSPSEEREERCLFGKQTIYYRRAREANCVVGERPNVEPEVTICPCSDEDFECEFNHVRDDSGECVLVSGTTPLQDDATCSDDGEYWYSRTAYRKIPMSQCEGGKRLDRGAPHLCPGLKHHSGWFWLLVIMIPFAFTALVASWYYRKSGMARGTIRLPGDGGRHYSDGGFMDTLASVPWFLIGIAGIAWEWVISRVEGLQFGRTRRGYRDLPVDEDAQILRFEDEE